MTSWFRNVFTNKFPIIGMVHIEALPGSPFYRKDLKATIFKAVQEAKVYADNGVDAIMIENMHDIPYVQSKDFGPETVAFMTKIATVIKQTIGTNVPCGIQILACGNREALAVAKACDYDFIRAEGYVFSHIADEGFTDADAGKLLRYRKHINAENVQIFTDIKKKHSSHAITNDVSLLEAVKAAEFFCSDGIVITGSSTGCETNAEEVKSLKNNVSLPLIVGSGVTLDNVDKYWNLADAAIVGSYFKNNGHWRGEINETKVRSFVKKLDGFRNAI